MDVLQKQIIDLNYKVDQLYQIVERISIQITALTAEKNPKTYKKLESVSKKEEISLSVSSNIGLERHKDIIEDNDTWENKEYQCSELEVSAEIQIRRLTTQLTAAYNRIALLEEQLIACRVQL